MIVRRLLYLRALAQEKHFGRAAEKCNVSQPTLSSAIRQLEDELGIPIVQRGHRFSGFTQEGFRVLEHANRVISESEKLKEELSQMREGLAGFLRIGVMPSALPIAALTTSRFGKNHPGVSIEIVNRSAQQILTDIEDFSLDIGVSYLTGSGVAKVREMPLYTEHLSLLTPLNSPIAEQESITWKEAAKTPMVLLNKGMQNRQTIDNVFTEQGCEVVPQIETNSLMNLAAHVRSGGWSSIVPRECFAFCSEPPGTCMVKLVEPEVSNAVGLQMGEIEYPSVVTENFFKAAEELDIDSMFI
ncbi:MAG: LysR family transcriptional regulator [Rhodospirillales bacterium]|nr:LysR family transcriptional regulator [Rhodospirillales bacterium]